MCHRLAKGIQIVDLDGMQWHDVGYHAGLLENPSSVETNIPDDQFLTVQIAIT